MSRLPLICLLLLPSLALSACHRIEPGQVLPEASVPAPAEGSKTSLGRKPASRPSRAEALSLCDAYMGFEKNDCLDKVRQDYAQVVASIGDVSVPHRHAG